MDILREVAHRIESRQSTLYQVSDEAARQLFQEMLSNGDPLKGSKASYIERIRKRLMIEQIRLDICNLKGMLALNEYYDDDWVLNSGGSPGWVIPSDLYQQRECERRRLNENFPVLPQGHSWQARKRVFGVAFVARELFSKRKLKGR